ncbi:MAG TPA: acyclic terpene utilization AtuA family protein [Bryobacteraceae bacterium]|nr:acyclic terpene utilization AtuA family protein [Bryobacteraceae bacterium]
MIRIANGQGFWGDSPDAPVSQVRRGPIDYLTLDYLAEVTMSILQKQRARDPELGYARDFVEVVERILPDLVTKNIRLVANAGGLNPEACRRAVRAVAQKQGLEVPIATVSGDDITNRIDELIDRGVEFRNMDTGEPLSIIRDRVRSASVYFGAFPIAEALGGGAQIVITGRCADAALVLGPMIHEFGWKADEWNKLAAGIVAGHAIECGAQGSGGNCQDDWATVPDLADIGYPIVEANPDGTFAVTKHKGTGGRVTVASVTEQLVYEIGDPRAYLTPDCGADFTSFHLAQDGPERVRCTGVKGLPATPFYKVSISFAAGFRAIGSVAYAWPDAYAKAKAGARILRERLERMGLEFDAIHSELLGANACHGIAAAEPSPELAAQLPEVVMRFGVRSKNRAAVDRFTKEIAPLVLSGPPSVTGLGAGRPKVEEVMAYWPALIAKSEVAPVVSQ